MEFGQRGLALVLSGRADILYTQEILSTVTVDVACLVEPGQRSIPNGLVEDTGAGVVAVLIGLAVGVDLASGLGLLGGRSHGKASKHGGNNNSGLHFGDLY